MFQVIAFYDDIEMKNTILTDNYSEQLSAKEDIAFNTFPNMTINSNECNCEAVKDDLTGKSFNEWFNFAIDNSDYSAFNFQKFHIELHRL